MAIFSFASSVGNGIVMVDIDRHDKVVTSKVGVPTAAGNPSLTVPSLWLLARRACTLP